MGRFAMILLFFSVWAIAIALNEILFAANPFTLHSIMSALPQTLIFSSMLSAAVYLAKNKIMEAMHKGRPIDKRFVAEITPEVGHELNKMRQRVADYDQEKPGQWRDELQPSLGPENEFQGEEFELAKELFDKLSAAAAQGPIDPNDPDLQKLIAKAKEQGLNIQDIVAIAADQSVPAFPGMNLPDDIPAPEEKPAEQDESQIAEPEPLDPSKVATSQQNIENVLDKYRDLDRLAATPELKTDALSGSKNNTNTPLTLGSQAVQPIKSVNIHDLEQQQSLEQSRRQAQIDVLAQLARDEDEFIAKYQAAAAEGNQLAKAQAQGQNQSQGQVKAQGQAKAQTKAQTKGQSVVQAQGAAVANNANPSTGSAQIAANSKATIVKPATLEKVEKANVGGGIGVSASPKASYNSANGVSMLDKRAIVADVLKVESTQPIDANPAIDQAKNAEIYKARFKQVDDKEQLDIGEPEDKVITDPALAFETEGQDQVVNMVELGDMPSKPSGQGAGVHLTKAKVEPKVRPKAPDAPSLVDTSNLKKYQYVPPKKGAGLDTSALKKVKLPNYNRHDGPSRLSTPNKMGAWSFKPKSTAVSTSSLSNAERQELIARIKKSAHTSQPNAADAERNVGRTLTKKPTWMQTVQEQNQTLSGSRRTQGGLSSAAIQAATNVANAVNVANAASASSDNPANQSGVSSAAGTSGVAGTSWLGGVGGTGGVGGAGGAKAGRASNDQRSDELTPETGAKSSSEHNVKTDSSKN